MAAFLVFLSSGFNKMWLCLTLMKVVFSGTQNTRKSNCPFGREFFLFVCALLWTCHNNLAHLGERWQIARWNGSQHDWAGKQGRTGRSLPLCTGAKPISSQPGRALVGDLCVTALRMLWVYSVYGRKETGFAAMMTFLFNTNVMLPLIFLAAIFTGAVSKYYSDVSLL